MCRTEWGFSIALIAPMIFLSGPAAADQCDDLRDPEPRIVACTQSINSGKWKGHNQSINYNNRGNAYHDKGELDQAIADYDQAISTPTADLADAYNNRGGNAYDDKGEDWTRPSPTTTRPSNASRTTPSAPWYYNRGIAYSRQRRVGPGHRRL